VSGSLKCAENGKPAEPAAAHATDVAPANPVSPPVLARGLTRAASRVHAPTREGGANRRPARGLAARVRASARGEVGRSWHAACLSGASPHACGALHHGLAAGQAPPHGSIALSCASEVRRAGCGSHMTSAILSFPHLLHSDSKLYNDMSISIVSKGPSQWCSLN
jgi:hypothetical protein